MLASSWHVLSTLEGEAALAATMARRPLLAFDFDGTLAPIVARPDDARLSRCVAVQLERLGARLPVAIVTGRSVTDVRGRLGFEPRYIVGSHGAEVEFDPAAAMAHAAMLNGVRTKLLHRSADIASAGILVEDKGQSIALHYRLSHDRRRARALIRALMFPPDPAIRVFAGKMVINVASAAAPDKADAVHALVTHSGSACAFFAGDDINDEPVFVSAPHSWLTVRVGRDDRASRAAYYVDSEGEIALLLERMLALT